MQLEGLHRNFADGAPGAPRWQVAAKPSAVAAPHSSGQLSRTCASRRQAPQPLRASAAVAEAPAAGFAPTEVAAPSSAEPPQRPESAAVLPPELRNVTAVLSAPNPDAPGGRTLVYVLGMSHVSAASLGHIDRLIKLVQPEVVMVELCKDRVTGLVDRDAVEAVRSHVQWVKLTGVPAKKGWPTQEQLLRLIRTRPGEAVGYQDIEEDPSRLLATGLFRSCRPTVLKPDRAGEFYPTFLEEEGGALRALRPMGAAEFILAPRQLPPVKDLEVRLDSSLRAAGREIPAETLEKARQAALAMTRTSKDEEGNTMEAATSVDLLMALRADLLQAASAAGCADGDVEVLFQGVENSRIEAVLRAVPLGRPASLSGLDSTAPGGDGNGIEPFRAQPRLVEIGISMRVPLDKVAENMPPRPPPEPLDPRMGADSDECRTQWRRWTEVEANEAEEAAKAEDKKGPLEGRAGIWANWLTQTYARFQDVAGLEVGVESGEAWRVAFRAAAATGVAQVLLGDRPAPVTARRMGDAVARSVLPLFGGACMLSAAADYAAVTGLTPEGTGPVAVLAGLAAVAASLAPVAGPILEVRSLSKKKAEVIEAAAVPSEPLDNGSGDGAVKLWGEDALLDWPGAMGPVIEERDAFMARTLAAAATGAEAVAPALVVDASADGGRVWRYAVGADGPTGVSPPGEGDGPYNALEGVSAVVGIVGTAHVRGIIRQWSAALVDLDVSHYVD